MGKRAGRAGHSAKWVVPHPRYDPRQPLLRELVLVHIAPEGDPRGFDVLLTLVPGIGEDIAKDADLYRVVHVQHESVDDDGRARFGWHAFVDVVWVPEPQLPPPERKTKRRQPHQ